MIEVQYNKRQMAHLQRRLATMPKKVPTIVSRAINKTATYARANAAREIKQEARIKISDIKKSMALSKANRKKLEASMDVDGKRIPLIAFGAKQLKRAGVSYRITERKKIPGAFIAKVGARTIGQVLANIESHGGTYQKHSGVFKRRGKSRLPIDQRFGPSIGHLFANAGKILRKWKRTANKRMNMEINRQIKVAMKKKK